MIAFAPDGVRRILCVGAHSDDIEIGCGGTLLKLASERPHLDVTWVVLSAEGSRAREARRAASRFLAGVKRKNVVVKRFRTSYFPYDGERIKNYFEGLKACEPDLIFTHYRDDRHQDHRVVSDLAWNTFRDHLILEYEIPKYDGDLGVPNCFVPIDEDLARTKVKLVCDTFRTQSDKHWFTEDTFLSLMRLRGIECASRTKYAEAFYCRKFLVQ